VKVLLIHPPTGRMISSILPEEVESGRGATPPLGLLYLAGELQRLGRDEAAVLDAQVHRPDDALIRKKIASFSPDVVGVTALSFTMPDVLAVCGMAKEAGATTVLGGPHPHIYPEETAALEGVDYVLMGEGEKSLPALLDCIRDERTPDDVPGAVWLENGKVRRGPPPSFIENLDTLRLPARELTDVRAYTSVLARTGPVTTMMSSRGCPHRCLFCDRPHLGSKFRARSPESVVEEIERCLGMGIREILFYDDNFAAGRERAMQIARLIISRGLKVTFDVRLRVTDLDPGLASALKRAGCDRVHLGVESGDPEILKTLRKAITVEDARAGFENARKAGMRTLAYFLVGSPGETRQTVNRSIRLAKELKPDYVHFSLLMPFPGTDLYRMGLEKGLWDGDPWLEFARNPTREFRAPVWNENFSREELIGLTLGAYRSFYRDPAYILRRLKTIRGPGEAIRQARAGLKILRL